MTRIEEERLEQLIEGYTTWAGTASSEPQVHRDTASALLELKELRAQGGVRVASLKWTDYSREGDYTLFTARNEVGSFAYGKDIDGLHYHQSSIRSQEHPSEEMARSAAENDHLEMVRTQAVRLGILSALETEAAEPVVTGWQPIETAPKDGTYLVYRQDGREGREEKKPYGNGNSHMAVMSAHPNIKILDGCFSFDLPQPTHWMPLPSPPALSSESKP